MAVLATPGETGPAPVFDAPEKSKEVSENVDAASTAAIGTANASVPVYVFAVGNNHHAVYVNEQLLMNFNREGAGRATTHLREGDIIAVRLGDRFDIMSLWMMFQAESGEFLFETSGKWIAYLPVNHNRWWEIQKGQQEVAAQFVQPTANTSIW